MEAESPFFLWVCVWEIDIQADGADMLGG
jgi:hypothetical protein